eukprot:2725539-Pleurochrysis_carterae.AAC.1
MEGFEEYDKTTREKLVCKVRMALEVGRQGGHLWQQANTDFFEEPRLHSILGRTMHLHPPARRLVSPRH